MSPLLLLYNILFHFSVVLGAGQSGYPCAYDALPIGVGDPPMCMEVDGIAFGGGW